MRFTDQKPFTVTEEINKRKPGVTSEVINVTSRCSGEYQIKSVVITGKEVDMFPRMFGKIKKPLFFRVIKAIRHNKLLENEHKEFDKLFCIKSKIAKKHSDIYGV